MRESQIGDETEWVTCHEVRIGERKGRRGGDRKVNASSKEKGV